MYMLVFFFLRVELDSFFFYGSNDWGENEWILIVILLIYFIGYVCFFELWYKFIGNNWKYSNICMC